MFRARLIDLSGIANICAGILVVLFLSIHPARDLTIGAFIFGSGQIWLGYVLWTRYGIGAYGVRATLGRQVIW